MIDIPVLIGFFLFLVQRIAQLLHQIALMSDIRSGNEAVKIIRNS
jgi:TRAP-type mannitol/chloroaromatic compound transport system permease small subunit